LLNISTPGPSIGAVKEKRKKKEEKERNEKEKEWRNKKMEGKDGCLLWEGMVM